MGVFKERIHTTVLVSLLLSSPSLAPAEMASPFDSAADTPSKNNDLASPFADSDNVHMRKLKQIGRRLLPKPVFDSTATQKQPTGPPSQPQQQTKLAAPFDKAETQAKPALVERDGHLSLESMYPVTSSAKSGFGASFSNVVTPWSPSFLPGLTPEQKAESVFAYEKQLGVPQLLANDEPKTVVLDAKPLPAQINNKTTDQTESLKLDLDPTLDLQNQAADSLQAFDDRANGAGAVAASEAEIKSLLDPNRFSLPTDFSLASDTKNLFPELTPLVKQIIGDDGNFKTAYTQNITTRFPGPILPFKNSLLSLMLVDYSITSAEHSAASDKAGVSEARAAYLPQLSTIMSAGRERINSTNTGNSDQGYNEVDLFLSQLITDFGKTTASINESKATYKKALNTLNETRMEVLRNGIEAFTNVVRDSDIVQLNLRNQKRVREQLLVEERRVKLGQGYVTDVLEIKARLSRTKANVAIAKRDLMVSRATYFSLFQTYPGDLTDVPMPPVPKSIMPHTLEQAKHQALLTNPKLIELRRERDIAKAQMCNAKSGMGPTLNVVGESLLKNNVDGIAGQRHENSIGLELNYKIYGGGADLAAIRKAREQYYAVMDTYKDTEFKILAEVTTEWHTWKAAESTSVYLAQQSRELEVFLDLAQKERLLGRRSLLDLLVADVNSINAETSAVTAKAEATVSAYTLLETMGTLQLINLP